MEWNVEKKKNVEWLKIRIYRKELFLGCFPVFQSSQEPLTRAELMNTRKKSYSTQKQQISAIKRITIQLYGPQK